MWLYGIQGLTSKFDALRFPPIDNRYLEHRSGTILDTARQYKTRPRPALVSVKSHHVSIPHELAVSFSRSLEIVAALGIVERPASPLVGSKWS